MGVVMPKPVRIQYRRMFFLVPRMCSLRPSKQGPGEWVVAFGFTAGHAERRLIRKIDPDMYWPGTVAEISYTS